MNTCDFEETKRQALLKFEELCKEPDMWAEITHNALHHKRMNYYVYVNSDNNFGIACGNTVLLKMDAFLKETRYNKYYKLAKGLMDHQRCKELLKSMNGPRMPLPGRIEVIPDPIRPTLWSKFKTWMRKD